MLLNYQNKETGRGIKLIESNDKDPGKSKTSMSSSTRLLNDINPILETIDFNNIAKQETTFTDPALTPAKQITIMMKTSKISGLPRPKSSLKLIT